MKKLLVALGAALFLSLGVSAQAEIAFEKDVHDFGTMKQHGDASTEFVFKNTGSEPLIVANAKGSCGCTVPTWPKEPIAPGAKASVEVKYDTKRVGPISKSVTITSNSVDQSTALLKIKGTVQAVATESDSPEMKTIEGATPVSE